VQVRCVKAFGVHVPGDTAEVPDGAAVDPEHWQPVTDVPAHAGTDAALAVIAAGAAGLPGSEGM
jgi:hypothetical protein